MSAAASLVAVALASGTAITALVPTSVVAVVAVTSIASIRFRISIVAASAAVALSFFRKAVQGSVVEIGLVFDSHELSDVLHRRRFEVLARGKEGKAMLLAVGAELPLLGLFVRRVGFHALGQS